MILSPPTLEDRLAIQDLLVGYCIAVDDHDWLRFASLFIEQAVLDFSAFGGPRCTPPQMVEYLRGVAAALHGWQHTISTVELRSEGPERVRARTAAQVFLTSKSGSDGPGQVSFVGLWYRDLLVRTSQGWLIAERVQQFAWVHNTPQG